MHQLRHGSRAERRSGASSARPAGLGTCEPRSGDAADRPTARALGSRSSGFALAEQRRRDDGDDAGDGHVDRNAHRAADTSPAALSQSAGPSIAPEDRTELIAERRCRITHFGAEHLREKGGLRAVHHRNEHLPDTGIATVIQRNDLVSIRGNSAKAHSHQQHRSSDIDAAWAETIGNPAAENRAPAGIIAIAPISAACSIVSRAGQIEPCGVRAVRHHECHQDVKRYLDRHEGAGR